MYTIFSLVTGSTSSTQHMGRWLGARETLSPGDVAVRPPRIAIERYVLVYIPDLHH